MSAETNNDVAYIKRVQAEIEAEAAKRRKNDPELVLHEQEMQRVWANVVPAVGGIGKSELSDRVKQLAIIDANAPTGARFGRSHLKRMVRKLTRWYMHFVVNQLNVLHHHQSRLFSDLDQRLTRLELKHQKQVSLEDFGIDAIEVDTEVIEAVVQKFPDVEGQVVAVACGTGEMVAGLEKAGHLAHGVEESSAVVASATCCGLDLRVAQPVTHFNLFDDASLGAVVIGAGVQRQPIGELLILLNEVTRCVSPQARIAVVVADPSSRSVPEAELYVGCGLTPETWAYLLEKRGYVTEKVPMPTSVISTLVFAQKP